MTISTNMCTVEHSGHHWATRLRNGRVVAVHRTREEAIEFATRYSAAYRNETAWEG